MSEKWFRIPYNSNLLYLPIMYFLPKDIIAKCPTLMRLPRKVRKVIYEADMVALVESEQFSLEIMDSVAYMVFPHFGFRGWKEDYTGYHPVWQLCYFLPLWRKALEDIIGWNVQKLFFIPSSESIPYFSDEYIREVMKAVVERVISEQNWQPILDVVREIPCIEDFEKRNSNVKKDFIRKWYHTRSIRVQMVSLESCIEDKSDSIHQLEDITFNMERDYEQEEYCERFISSLSEKDRKILELRIEGYKHKQIGKMLGYRNHSGVVKRMQKIAKMFEEYQNKHNS